METQDSNEKTEIPGAMQKISTDNDMQKQKRRQLLKGTVALPVVITLHSGAALARSSNIIKEAEDVSKAVFVETVNGPQLLCIMPKATFNDGTYDIGDNPTYFLVTEPKIELNAADQVIHDKKLKQMESCHLMGGIMISGLGFTSIAARPNGAFDGLSVITF